MGGGLERQLDQRRIEAGEARSRGEPVAVKDLGYAAWAGGRVLGNSNLI